MKRLSALAALWVVAASLVQAGNINWGSDPGSSNYNSYGAPLTASFHFEIGKFTTAPTPGNIHMWDENWVPLDSSVYSPLLGYFTGAPVLNDNSVFGTSDQGYLFVYNTLHPAPGQTAEWAVLTNPSWLFPSAGGGPGALPANWFLSDATVRLYGGSNGGQGPGAFTAPSGGFDLQTHRVTVPVPEPGSVVFGLVGLGLMLRRRK
jgi:PEP-CTERM motif